MGLGAPSASDLILSKQKYAQKTRAKTFQAAKAGLPRKRRVSAKDHNGNSGTWKGQRLLAKGERRSSVAEQQGQGDFTESDDVSAEEEDDTCDDDGDDETGEQQQQEEEEEEEIGRKSRCGRAQRGGETLGRATCRGAG